MLHGLVFVLFVRFSELNDVGEVRHMEEPMVPCHDRMSIASEASLTAKRLGTSLRPIPVVSVRLSETPIRYKLVRYGSI